MKLTNVVTGTLVLTLLFLAGCVGGGGKGDPATMAEQFMELYYTKANLQDAKALATPAAAQKMEEKFGPAAGAAPGEKGTGHEVSYTLKERSKEGKHAYSMYETTITSKEGGSVRKQVYVSIDVVDGAWRITDFSETALAPAPTAQ